MDEFCGDIAINHLLRWLDRYPCIIEIKGSSVVLQAKKIWITSNVDPRNWYLGEKKVNSDQIDALMRRMKIVHFDVMRQFDE
jgi:hypothetical protein